MREGAFVVIGIAWNVLCPKSPQFRSIAMAKNVTRRTFLGAAGPGAAAIAATSAFSASAAENKAAIKIIGVCCSPRQGKSTATSLAVCLEAAQAVSDKIETELIERTRTTANKKQNKRIDPQLRLFN